MHVSRAPKRRIRKLIKKPKNLNVTKARGILLYLEEVKTRKIKHCKYI
ncbi:hypothetical protein J5U22_01605 [Saccharolobus shibatae]|uniref:Uncharacterized protein n=1 Tax=Saccharolobus shibatae TaxID=2286 RepID=A0A8F5BV83_9CREN|nr:hypothetical protein J5U21_01727 [Saccharolobus shibatae]QXJ35058.1 hypothetical protein J5U22_01605 [Saccharolobus shibatae]